MRGRGVSQERQFSVATMGQYAKFCRERPSYHHSWPNQLRVMDWVHERRIEMLAEGRPHWVPSVEDFERGVRDCWDDLGEKNALS